MEGTQTSPLGKVSEMFLFWIVSYEVSALEVPKNETRSSQGTGMLWLPSGLKRREQTMGNHKILGIAHCLEGISCWLCWSVFLPLFEHEIHSAWVLQLSDWKSSDNSGLGEALSLIFKFQFLGSACIFVKHTHSWGLGSVLWDPFGSAAPVGGVSQGLNYHTCMSTGICWGRVKTNTSSSEIRFTGTHQKVNGKTLPIL